jgi:hypothetical protein
MVLKINEKEIDQEKTILIYFNKMYVIVIHLLNKFIDLFSLDEVKKFCFPNK